MLDVVEKVDHQSRESHHVLRTVVPGLMVYLRGCISGWGLAYVVDNELLSLRDWDVDFAVWCVYKYLNSGPVGTGRLFVREKWNGGEMSK